MKETLKKETFQEGIKSLCLLFTNPPTFTDKKLDAWYSVLKKELTDNEFNEAIEKAVLKETFFPSIADLIEYSGKQEGFSV